MTDIIKYGDFKPKDTQKKCEHHITDYEVYHGFDID